MKHFYIPEISGRCPLRQPRQNVSVTLHQILDAPEQIWLDLELRLKFKVQVNPKKNFNIFLIDIFKVYTKFQISSTSLS